MIARLEVLGLCISRRKTEQGRFDRSLQNDAWTFICTSNSLFQVAANSYTRGHSRKLVKAHCRTDTRLHFFSHRVLNRWNSLTTQYTADACSVNAFKRHLNMIRVSKMGFFMDSWPA